MRAAVITMSDRASRGEYEDRSGPEAVAALEAFFSGTRWEAEVDRRILPDDAAKLGEVLAGLEQAGFSVVVVTGGTGIGPRDITPETVTAFCERTIPGIMEHIRLKYGNDKPNALLSRSVAGVKGGMLVYAVPGSVRAVREYMTEIVRTMDHAIMMARAVDAH
jgi:molybdenum cofactor synthesis domain-containing protein